MLRRRPAGGLRPIESFFYFANLLGVRVIHKHPPARERKYWHSESLSKGKILLGWFGVAIVRMRVNDGNALRVPGKSKCPAFVGTCSSQGFIRAIGIGKN